MLVNVQRFVPGQLRQVTKALAAFRCLMPIGGTWMQPLWMPEQWPSPKRLATGMPDLPNVNTLY